MEITQSVTGFLNQYDYENVTVDATVGGVGLNQNKIGSFASQSSRDQGAARIAFITTETADIRFSFDGVAVPPVAATTGHLLPAGSTLTLASRTMMKNIRFIRETATSGTLRVAYLR